MRRRGLVVTTHPLLRGVTVGTVARRASTGAPPAARTRAGGAAWVVGLLATCLALLRGAAASPPPLADALEPPRIQAISELLARRGVEVDPRVLASLHQACADRILGLRDSMEEAFARAGLLPGVVETPEALDAALRVLTRALADADAAEAQLFAALAGTVPPEQHSALQGALRARRVAAASQRATSLASFSWYPMELRDVESFDWDAGGRGPDAAEARARMVAALDGTAQARRGAFERLMASALRARAAAAARAAAPGDGAEAHEPLDPALAWSDAWELGGASPAAVAEVLETQSNAVAAIRAAAPGPASLTLQRTWNEVALGTNPATESAWTLPGWGYGSVRHAARRVLTDRNLAGSARAEAMARLRAWAEDEDAASAVVEREILAALRAMPEVAEVPQERRWPLPQAPERHAALRSVTARHAPALGRALGAEWLAAAGAAERDVDTAPLPDAAFALESFGPEEVALTGTLKAAALARVPVRSPEEERTPLGLVPFTDEELAPLREALAAHAPHAEDAPAERQALLAAFQAAREAQRREWAERVVPLLMAASALPPSPVGRFGAKDVGPEAAAHRAALTAWALRISRAIIDADAAAAAVDEDFLRAVGALAPDMASDPRLALVAHARRAGAAAWSQGGRGGIGAPFSALRVQLAGCLTDPALVILQAALPPEACRAAAAALQPSLPLLSQRLQSLRAADLEGLASIREAWVKLRSHPQGRGRAALEEQYAERVRTESLAVLARAEDYRLEADAALRAVDAALAPGFREELSWAARVTRLPSLFADGRLLRRAMQELDAVAQTGAEPPDPARRAEVRRTALDALRRMDQIARPQEAAAALLIAGLLRGGAAVDLDRGRRLSAALLRRMDAEAERAAWLLLRLLPADDARRAPSLLQLAAEKGVALPG